MPLSAFHDGQPVTSSLLTDEAWAELRASVRARQSAISMRCGWPGYAKESRLGTRYFAHKPGGDGCSAGESAQHLLAKDIIVRAAAAAGWEVQAEYRIGDAIADVYATFGERRCVLEVQWSPQSLDDYWLRQERYRAAGIPSIAWFARRMADLDPGSKTLPAFPLTVDTEERTASVVVDGSAFTLEDAVTRLLTGKLRHRTHYTDGQPAAASLVATVQECYRCHQGFGIWGLREVPVASRCGKHVQLRGSPDPAYTHDRPEDAPVVKAEGRWLAEQLGVEPAELATRASRTAGTEYLGFICPHCRTLSGDHFVREQFEHDVRAEVEVVLPSAAALAPHWCVGGPDGMCDEVPAAFAAAFDPHWVILPDEG